MAREGRRKPPCFFRNPLTCSCPRSLPTIDAFPCRGVSLSDFARSHEPEQSTVDLLIIGGGINGAGIARDAAGRGYKVLLVEQDDLASGTSSASTKLIHGGLRY